MARKKYYVGDVGPMLFDDESPIDDQDGDFAGEDRVAFRTDGSVRASGADSHEDSLVKKSTYDTLQDEVTTLDIYAKDHGDEHLPVGADPIPTKIITVVTSVDFVAESVTTEDITVIDEDAT